MVFFICNACGESIKKNQVDNHCQFKCRNCKCLSCVDCGKDFWGSDYIQHIKCITEDEKYGGKDFKLKASANKGERKQEEWTMHVQAAIQKCDDRNLKMFLGKLESYPNVPRKKPKFENFLRSCMRIPHHLHGPMFDAISAEFNKEKAAAENGKVSSSTQDSAEKQPTHSSTSTHSNDSNTNGNTKDKDNETVSGAKKLSKRERKEERQKAKHKAEKKDKTSKEEQGEVKKTKRKRSNEEEEPEQTNEDISNTETKKKKKKSKGKDEDEPVSKKMKQEDEAAAEQVDEAEEAPAVKFRWENVIVAVLKKQEDHELSIKKLRKKVISEYFACHGDTGAHEADKLQSKFNKKITKNPRLRVLKERVKLIS